MWEKFLGFCGGNAERALLFEVKDVANFVSSLYNSGSSGSAVNAAISALDATRGVVSPDSLPLAQVSMIKALRGAAKKRRPSGKKANQPVSYFDPYTIFKHCSEIKEQGNKKAKLDPIRDKLATLLLLDGALRVNELSKIFVENIKLGDNKAQIKLPWTKEERSKKWTYIEFHCSCFAVQKVGPVENKQEDQDELDFEEPFRKSGPLWRTLCCSFCSLKFYLSNPRVIARRRKVKKIAYESPDGKLQEGSPLFITHRSTAGAIATKSLSKRIKLLMEEAGVDTKVWSVHSCRGAAVSKLYNMGCSKRRCMEFGRWSASSSLERYYLKQARFKEKSHLNKDLPSWELLRRKATLLNDSL